ncbi:MULTISPECIES: hypothetical protein [Comamonas]|jgi:hypothetical protein|uniref:hypothetical protein n=1 Tax=Comamonas TaxID=283 RepID=UPI002449A56B|nr:MULTISPECIES: hypothetical protein [Comamonas]MDH0050151.1 hypothetical protein [Comamonas terrigena]MDH0512617.1 hypothetical protein [Comamonas terrigena]MDH1092123.1 hypothetical protein [Comamonas terrigena]
MEQTISQVTTSVFSKNDELRYQQLASLYIDGKTTEQEEEEFNALRQKKIAARADRERCILQVIKEVTQNNISLAELIRAGLELPNITDLYKESEILKAAKSINDNSPAKAVEPAKVKTTGKKREVKGYIKSIKNSDETGVWRAGPPSFFKAEGGFETYESGASIDQWLVDPEDSQSKIKLLKKLEEKSGKAPTQEQLGSITVESYQNG